MNYIDVKVTVWNRLKFSDDSDMAELVKMIEQNSIDEVIDDTKGFLESETLYDTEEELTPEDNGSASTIEVYEKKKLLWENGKNIK